MGEEQNRSHLHKHLIGQFVTVRVQKGTVYSGVFHEVKETPKGADFHLRMAKDVADVLMVPAAEMVIHWDDFVELSAVHVETHLRNSAFQIDSEISGAQLQERELTAWNGDDADADEVGLLASLDGDMGDDWDQFAVNSNKFGVKSTYDEEMYTTKLDKDSSFYKERLNTATKLAQDIQKQTTKNIHLQEERTGLILSQDQDVDEESLYSSVLREDSDGGNRKKDGKITSLISTGSRNSSPSRRQQPKNVDALGLDSTTVVVPENVIQDFMAFKTNQKPEKTTAIEQLKNFSASIDKKVSGNTPAGQKPKDTTSTTPSLSLPKAKLDPNAREFTPMSFKVAPVPAPVVIAPAVPYGYPPMGYVTGPTFVAPAQPRRGVPAPVYRSAYPVPIMGMMGFTEEHVDSTQQTPAPTSTSTPTPTTSTSAPAPASSPATPNPPATEEKVSKPLALSANSAVFVPGQGFLRK
eukprot:TRINITY_DN14258_c0_g1_i1.p1 TRINITY_DN14258_c0_g1~~TRINITY_DN14258_c0_g1_i1.p1  ORF type:complete len:466 (+),score=101.52 TRINITY_DN14258_c0_g1_i1:33-1430(+)